MTVKSRALTRLNRAVRHLSPRHVVRTQLTRRVIATFAEKAGLVYFGDVDQRDDDHRLVRGHTVSATHADSHYCIGTVRNYDVVLLLRNDVVALPKAKEQHCHWLIYTIDLHTKADIPHIYIGHKNREQAYQTSYARLSPLALGHTASYQSQFTAHYKVYGQPAHALDIEHIITPDIAAVIASHFHGASIEIEDNTIYLYIESNHPREALLEKMLSNALWLAEQIDEGTMLSQINK